MWATESVAVNRSINQLIEFIESIINLLYTYLIWMLSQFACKGTKKLRNSSIFVQLFFYKNEIIIKTFVLLQKKLLPLQLIKKNNYK